MPVLVGLVLLLATSSAAAWNETGHRLICQLAFEQLTAESKRFIERTLETGRELGANNFADACVWADEARFGQYHGTYEQHFIHAPGFARNLDFLRDCAALDCVAVGIQRNLTYLAGTPSGSRERLRKAAALYFLGHYVGDLYQPLHVGNVEDDGGSRINVLWFGEESSLHAVWDEHILQRAGLSYPDSVSLLSAIALDDEPINVLDALQQSFKLARSHAYTRVSGAPISSGATLGEAYFERARPVVLRQLATAARHLANLINGTVDGTQNTNILIE